ncbi:MAG TPA: aldehyde dehydrogenase family protein [Bdellovibrionota bacterium]|nr:aldehyde dehydrogenase family protein [Bdellovibrionota bacterium]
MTARKLLIGGKWVDSSSGKTFPTINPATEEKITDIAEATVEDVDRAVKAARAALEGPWGSMSAKDRGKIVWKIGELLMHKVDEVASLETADNGKPIFESRYIDVPVTADCFQYYAGWATKFCGETIPIGPNSFNYTLREPIGVVAAITPWNFPLLLAAWKVAPALAMGNTVILKPASWTPLTALKLGEICQEAGLPDGVMNVITGPGGTIGMALANHPGVDKIAFTGETNTGKSIMKSGADTLKKISLELGGKSPNVVFADADLDAAAKGASIGIFYGKGEVCAAGSRLFVEAKVHEQFMDKLLSRVEKLQPADPMDPKTRMGAIVAKKQMDKVLEYIDIGKKEGAKLVSGGESVKVGGKGYYLKPTVFDQVDNKMRIAQEEIFGPVLATIPFNDVDDAVAKANDTIYGLASAVWTRDIKKAHAFAKKVKAGTVWINTYNQYDAASPFGGYKQSGYGRELGIQALEMYTQTKTVWVDLT